MPIWDRVWLTEVLMGVIQINYDDGYTSESKTEPRIRKKAEEIENNKTFRRKRSG